MVDRVDTGRGGEQNFQWADNGKLTSETENECSRYHIWLSGKHIKLANNLNDEAFRSFVFCLLNTLVHS